MGQKSNPIALRLGINRIQDSRWTSNTYYYGDYVQEDYQIRRYLETKMTQARLITGDCLIQRSLNKIEIVLFVSDIKRDDSHNFEGATRIYNVEQLSNALTKLTNADVLLLIRSVSPKDSALLLSKYIAKQMEERKPFGAVLRKAMSYVYNVQNPLIGKRACGIKVQCSGRLNGEDIARTEWFKKGRIPLHSLQEIIDYGHAEAHTIYGICGIKVWICYSD